MKVLIATDEYFANNGISTSVKNLERELLKKGHDVRILTVSKTINSIIDKNVYYYGSFLVPINTGDRYSFLRNNKFTKELINWKPDIIHIQTEFSAYKIACIIAKKTHAPIINTCHAIHEYYIDYIISNKKLGKIILKKMLNKIYNKSSLLIVPTNKVVTYMKDYRVKTKIEVVPTGIELSKFDKPMSLAEKEALFLKYNITKTKRVLVTVSRLGIEKNIDELIMNFKKLVSFNDSYVLLIVGDGRDRLYYEKIVKDGNLEKLVIFTGMIPNNEVYKYYKLGDVFVSASKSETQGLTYVEALAAGLPLVCYRDECLKDVLTPGKNGYFYTNDKEFINSIENIYINKEIPKMSKISYIKSKRFRAEEFSESILDLYKKVVSSSVSKNLNK